MAEIAYTQTVVSDSPGNPYHVYSWALAAAGADDTGQPAKLIYLADKTVQLLGTLGTFLLQGSNDLTAPSNWFTLHDASHAIINETGGARGEQILENPIWIRPNASGAASGVTVIITGRMPKV